MGEPSGDATGERCGRLRLDPLVATGIAVDAVVLRKGGGACGAARGGASETSRLIACIVSIELGMLTGAWREKSLKPLKRSPQGHP